MSGSVSLLENMNADEKTPPSLAGSTVGSRFRWPHLRRRTLWALAAVAVVLAGGGTAAGLVVAGVIGGAPASTTHVFDLKMYGPYRGWAWAGGNDILHTNSGVQQWTIVPPPIGSQLITGVAWRAPTRRES